MKAWFADARNASGAQSIAPEHPDGKIVLNLDYVSFVLVTVAVYLAFLAVA